MLKVEYPCREILSSYQNQTWAEAKKHLHDVRLRRQQQLASNINECHKLHTIHKQIFNRQFNSSPIDKRPDGKPMNNEYSLHTKKYSIPRIEYASVIYRQAIPTFEVESSTNLDDNVPMVRELTQYLSDSSCAISAVKTENNRSVSSTRKHQQRRLSVSSVSSVDKRANKVYEKWPDYNEISEIVGYRIDPPPVKISASNPISSRPSGALVQRKRTSTSEFSAASKQIKNVIALNSPAKNKKSTKKTDTSPIIIDKPSVTIEPALIINPITETKAKVFINNPIKEAKPKLPNILCPSSIMYSNRIQTRQWLMKNDFSSNAIRTLPLI